MSRRIQIVGRGLAGLALAAVALLVLFAAPALGAKTHRLKTSFATAARPNDVAVEEASGNVFVAEGGPCNCVLITGPEGGAPSGVSPAEIGGFTASPSAVAVDNAAASPSKGALYVAQENGVVKKFVRKGEKYEEEEELGGTPAFGKVFGLAVDAKGDVFVADGGGKAVVEFDPAGVQIARFDVAGSVGSPAALAHDSGGDLFVCSGTAAACRFEANGGGEIETGTAAEQIVESGHAFGVAVDMSSDDLYVSMDGDADVEANAVRVAIYGGACATEGEGPKEHCVAEGEMGRGTLINPRRLAISAKTGFTYVAEPSIGGSDQPDIVVFGPTVIVPAAITGNATNVTGVSASASGTVDPSGEEVEECKFEYGVETDPGKPKAHPPVPPSFTYTNTAPCAESPAEIGAGNGPVPVEADLTGLGIGSKYHFRLVATSATTVPNEQGPSVGGDESFTTKGPQIHAESAAQVGDTTARLEGLVNPEGQATSYHFEYVADADFQESGYAEALSVPLGGEAIGSGSEDVKVAQQIGGLSPSTRYHFRILASNEAGTSEGLDKTFTTYSQSFPGLPDGRAYEQVTPVDKNGVAPVGEQSLVQAASGGGGITYLSGGSIPGAEGAQQFPNYLASRGADWSTQGLLPPASNGPSAAVLGWSEDLSQAYVTQARVLNAPGGFLQRDSTTRALRTVAEEVELKGVNYSGAASDGSVVVFESTTRLLESAPKDTSNAYVWDRASGALALLGVLPNGLAPAKGSLVGSNEPFSKKHYNQAQHAVSEDGSRAFFTDAATGQLYLRENPSAAEEECAVAGEACTVWVSAPAAGVSDPKKPATFWGATPDGSRAFFTSSGELTEDANTGAKGEGGDLYRYDVPSGELVDLTPDAVDPKGADVQGVLGSSDDGEYVYFAANGVLTSTPNARGQSAAVGDCSGIGGAASGACNLYLRHGASTVFIARLNANGDTDGDSSNWFSQPQLVTGKTARVSSDGQTLLLRSQEKLGDYDNKGVNEIYRYSAGGAAEMSCISCNPTGVGPGGAARLQSISKGAKSIAPASALARNLSSDGQRVFFESPDKLVAADGNGDSSCPPVSSTAPQGVRACQDVYEWEAQGAGSCHSAEENGGCLYLISSGTSPAPSYLADASASGNDAFFFTLQSLVGQDADQIVDIYDARVGGGIAAQNPPPPRLPCEATACRGPVAPPPAEQSSGSATFSGPGNPKPAKHKKKHHKKKHQHKKKQRKRQARRAR